jgi:hypothetical protein
MPLLVSFSESLVRMSLKAATVSSIHSFYCRKDGILHHVLLTFIRSLCYLIYNFMFERSFRKRNRIVCVAKTEMIL